jgi:hypothetical protein
MPRYPIRSKVEALVGRKVSIAISDPWEFGSEVGTEPIRGNIIEAKREHRANSIGLLRNDLAVIRLECPFAYRSLKWEYLLASPRHEGTRLTDVSTAEVVSFNFVRMPSEQASSDAPFDFVQCHAPPAIGLIGTMRLGPPECAA